MRTGFVSLVPQGRLNLAQDASPGLSSARLVQISFFHDSLETVQLESSSSAECSGQACRSTDQVPKGRNNQEPGTEVPGKHNQRIESPEGTAHNNIRPNQLLPGSTLTPNLISQAKFAAAARPIKSTPQSRPIR